MKQSGSYEEEVMDWEKFVYQLLPKADYFAASYVTT